MQAQVEIRRARPADAASIGAVHVAAWRSAYAGILPVAYLARLSALRQAAGYDATIRGGAGVFVATAAGRVVGFATTGPARTKLADGEVETIYVLDDHREQGAGRHLLRASAAWLAQQGCNSLFLWVLRDNPSRWFYERLGGRRTASGTVPVAGQSVPQDAYIWDPIERLLAEAPPALDPP